MDRCGTMSFIMKNNIEIKISSTFSYDEKTLIVLPPQIFSWIL